MFKYDLNYESKSKSMKTNVSKNTLNKSLFIFKSTNNSKNQIDSIRINRIIVQHRFLPQRIL